MKRWLIAVLVFAATATTTIAPADAASYQFAAPRVMSQNIYVGADISRLLAGESPAAILETVQQTNFPERAVEIAESLIDFRPDVLGLQEVYLISAFDSEGNVLFELDYLQILLASIDGVGQDYDVASSVTNANVTLPLDLEAGTFVTVTDRDVILYRTGTTEVSNPMGAHFDTNFTVDFGGFPLEFTRGYTAVDAEIKGVDFRIVNTHFEVEGAPCAGETGVVICQDVQAEQLVDVLADETLPTILLGDFNAEPGAAAYETIVDAGYIDTWLERWAYNNEPGYTCCQPETLDNEANELFQRIDHVFIHERRINPLWMVTTVVGDWDARKTPSGLWYSDHGGPWARIFMWVTP